METNDVFDLRKEAKDLNGDSKLKKLNEALTIAEQLYHEDRHDEWTQKALAWTLIDLCKYCISENLVVQAEKYYNQLQGIEFEYADDIIENQKKALLPKINTEYVIIQEAEHLSKEGKHNESLNIFKKLISENRLSPLHHEAYGWALYRYMKEKIESLTSIQIKKGLQVYLSLKNERPSLLHSTILNLALRYSKEHSDFNLYNFFKLWNPQLLRWEDKNNQTYDDKSIGSLVSRVLREFVEKDYDIDIDYLIENIDLGGASVGVESDELPF